MLASKRKHILMLLSNPATNDPRPIAEAKALVNSGFAVTIFAWDRNGKTSKQTSQSPNLLIRRFKLKTPYGQSLRTILGFALFYFWCFVYSISMNIQVVHCHDIDTLPCGILLKTLRNRKLRLIFDMHDHPSVFLEKFPKSSFLIDLSFVFIRRWVNRLIVVNEGFVNYLAKSGFKGKMITVIMNAFSVNVDRHRTKEGDSFNVVYYGPLTKLRGVNILVRAVEQLPHISLILAGKGDLVPWISEVQKTYSNIRYVGWISMSEISELVKKTDVIPCLSSANLKHKANHVLAAPGKFFTSIANGIPVIVPTGTFIAEITKKYNCGLVVDMAELQSISNGLRTLKENKPLYDLMAKNGLSISKSQFSWQVMEKRLLSCYSAEFDLLV